MAGGGTARWKVAKKIYGAEVCCAAPGSNNVGLQLSAGTVARGERVNAAVWCRRTGVVARGRLLLTEGASGARGQGVGHGDGCKSGAAMAAVVETRGRRGWRKGMAVAVALPRGSDHEAKAEGGGQADSRLNQAWGP